MVLAIYFVELIALLYLIRDRIKGDPCFVRTIFIRLEGLGLSSPREFLASRVLLLGKVCEILGIQNRIVGGSIELRHHEAISLGRRFSKTLAILVSLKGPFAVGLVKIADSTSVDTRSVEGNAFHNRRHLEDGIGVIALSAFDTKLDSNSGIIDQRHMLVFVDTRRHLFFQLEVIDSVCERVCRILQVLLIGLFDIPFNHRLLALNNLKGNFIAVVLTLKNCFLRGITTVVH